jgi:hypothetical protein
MRRLVLALAISAITTASIFAGSAVASGPATSGKEAIELQCAGLGPVTVSVPRPEASKGAGQIVGQKGHGIPVALNFILTDVTTNTVLVNESQLTGGGHSHPHQTTTQCTATFVELPASIFFDEHELPPGVEPSDIIRASFEAQVIIKR